MPRIDATGTNTISLIPTYLLYPSFFEFKHLGGQKFDFQFRFQHYETIKGLGGFWLKKTILLVLSEEKLMRRFNLFLTKHEVIEVSDYKKALIYYKKNSKSVDIIILDKQKPSPTWLIFEMIKSSDTFYLPPTILVSDDKFTASIASITSYVDEVVPTTVLQDDLDKVLTRCETINPKLNRNWMNRPQILVINPNEEDRLTLRHHLKRFRVKLAKSGKHAIERMKTLARDFDVVICHNELPDMKPEDVFIEAKINSSKSPYFIITSDSYNKQEALDLVQNHEVSAYFERPYKPEIAKELDILLEERRTPYPISESFFQMCFDYCRIKREQKLRQEVNMIVSDKLHDEYKQDIFSRRSASYSLENFKEMIKELSYDTGLSIPGRKRRNILVIEDDLDYQEALKFHLKKHYDLHFAKTLSMAREMMASDQSYEIVILDIEMPDGKGFDFIETIQHKLGEETIIFVLTSYSDSETISKSIRRGTCEFINKQQGSKVLLQKLGDYAEKIYLSKACKYMVEQLDTMMCSIRSRVHCLDRIIKRTAHQKNKNITYETLYTLFPECVTDDHDSDEIIDYRTSKEMLHTIVHLMQAHQKEEVLV